MNKLLRYFFPLTLILTVDLGIAHTAAWAENEVEPFALVFTSSDSKILCLESKNAQINAGALLQLYYCNGSNAQRWTLKKQRLHGIAEKCIKIVEYSKKAQLASCKDDSPLTWMENDPSTKNIYLDNSKKDCLAPSNQVATANDNVIAVNCNKPEARAWKQIPLVAKLQSGNLKSNTDGRVKVKDKDMQAEIRSDGLIYIKGKDKPFNSKHPQSLSKKGCTINGLSWSAYYTTFYIIKNDKSLWLVNSCGKAPLIGDTEDSVEIKSNDGQINHSVIAQSATVLGAGEIDIVDGEIKYIDNCSGHYKPNKHLLLHGIYTLAQAKAKGLTERKLRIEDLKNVSGGGESSKPTETEREGTGECDSYTIQDSHKSKPDNASKHEEL